MSLPALELTKTSFWEPTEVPRPRLRHRLQAAFWEHNRPVRRVAGVLRRWASLAAFKLRSTFHRNLPPRVVTHRTGRSTPALVHPAIVVASGGDVPPNGVSALLEAQTESSIVVGIPGATGPRFAYYPDGACEGLPPTHLESLLMAAAAEDLDWVVGGWSPPAPGRYGPAGEVLRDPQCSDAASVLVRLPTPVRQRRPPVVGRAVAHIRDAHGLDGFEPLEQSFCRASGPYRLRSEISNGAIVTQPVHDVEQALIGLPPVDGPRTVMFLLPFLAIGGAERLLLDLVEVLRASSRVLVVSTDPHLEHLGQTVEAFRELTPYVYTLGDWLPQLAVPSAVTHLIRRWRVESLMCWNGNVLFFDHAAALRKRFPDLRIINQLFNHEGGWIEHYCPSFVGAVDCHVAVNTATARALVRNRSVPDDNVVTIHHGVRVPEPPPPDEARRRRAEARERLGIPVDAPVVGTFIRLHSQKRPQDVVRVARALSGAGIRFLLVGGGPLSDRIDRMLETHPVPNLIRMPMLTDPMELYDAVDICLLTSSFEGLPVFLLDGLARGIPCVATAVGDIPLLLEAGGGIAVDTPGDIAGLAAGVRALAEHPDRRAREGELGRSQVISRFDLPRFVAAYEAAIFPQA